MAPRTSLRTTLLCALLLGGIHLNASAADLICTDRWGHRYTMVKPPSDDTENIKCTSADGSPLRKPSAVGRQRAAPAPERTYGTGAQPPAPVATAVAKPARSGPVEPQSVLGLKSPLSLPANPPDHPPANATQVFGFGGTQALPPPPASPASAGAGALAKR